MSRVVLDSSAILAFLQQEPGADVVTKLLHRAIASAVNVAEVQSKLIRDGMPAEEAKIAVERCLPTIEPFDSEQAGATAALILPTQKLGLSLGDRACLALGLATKAPVYTADRAWAHLQVGVDVRLVR